ncbi:MAG: LysR family transcriptional regulator [Firmicutes bacterium]|nr:LysR family transcriptional regulator [Bacillota bacterium]
MEIKLLEYFLMVAKEENITRAAQKLYITQPTLSRQLAKLEEELGVSLFKRGQYNITLTEEGELLRKRAQTIVHLTNSTKSELHKEQVELSGEITIGCAESVNMRILARWMKGFQEKNPNVLFEIQTGTADDMVEKMDKGLIDLALILKRLDYSSYPYIAMPLRDEFKVLLPENHPLASKEAITPKDLVGENLLIQKKPGANNIISSWLGKYLEKTHIVSYFSMPLNMAYMVQENMGVALTLDLDVQFKGLLCKSISPSIDVGSVLLYRNQENSVLVSEFIDYIRNTKSE